MARSRNIKPSFFKNDELAELNPLARLLFIGMWSIADFKGDFVWREKRVKVEILPYDNCDVKELAINLDKSGFIRFYSDEELIYCNVVNFAAHQNPHKNERAKGSEIPEFTESMRQAIDLKGLTINRDKNGTSPDNDGTNRADSCSLIPDSFNLKPLLDQSEIDQCFEMFWEAGMKKVTKKKTKPLFTKYLKDNFNVNGPTIYDLTNRLVEDVKARLESNQLGFAELHPTTYFNGERYNDEIVKTFNSDSGRGYTMDELGEEFING